MVAIFTTSGAALLKAGANVSSDLTGLGILGKTAEEIINQWINEAESVINVTTRNNYSDSYASLNTDVKMILNEVASALTAIQIVSYDMSGLSRIEAEDRVNIQRDAALRGLSLLRPKNAQDFVDAA